MKSSILKTTLLAGVTVIAGAITSSAAAGTHKYTFVGSSGTVYCDGFTVSTTDKVTYSGTHTGSCLASNPPADGFASRIKGFIPVVSLATTYPGSNAYIIIYSSKAGAWNLYTDSGGVLTLVNSGTLQVGAPPASQHPGAHPMTAASDPHPNPPRGQNGLNGY